MDDFEQLTVTNNLIKRIEALEADLRSLQMRDASATQLTEISDDAGVIRAGAFVCGDGDPLNNTDAPFTGVALLQPGIDPAGTGASYNLVGMNAGTLEAGISAADGKFYAGGGEVVLDADGIKLNCQSTSTVGTSTIKWNNGTNVPVSIVGVSNPGTNESAYITANTLSATENASIHLNVYQSQTSLGAAIDLVAFPATSAVDVTAMNIFLTGNVIIGGIPGSLTLNDQSVDGLLIGGWINDNANAFVGQWTYVSAQQMRISGYDYTDRYTKGARVRLVNSTTKYFIVSSSSYSGGITTVTFVTNTTYVLTNTTISDIYYSYSISPSGWPGWFNYATTLAWTAGTAPSGTPTTNLAMFNIYGNTCQVSIFKAGFTAGATVTGVTATLPVPASPVAQNGYGLIRAANAPNTCISYINTTANIFCASAAATAMHFSATYEW